MPHDKPIHHQPDESGVWTLPFVAILLILIVLGTLLIVSTTRLARSQQYDFLVKPVLALSNAAQEVKPSPGTLLWYSCVNPNASAVFIQVYNSVGVIVVGTTAAALTFRVAPTSSTGFAQPLVSGAVFFSAGLQAAATTTQTGGTAPTTGVPCDFAIR